MIARFSGTILHAVTKIKRRKVTGEERKSIKKTLSEASHTPSKIYRDSLAKMSLSKYESRKRGPTAQEIVNMENEAKNNFEFTQLIPDLYKLRIQLLNKDEQLAIDNIIKGKGFGYLYFVNLADEINIICFTEGCLRWFQEIFVRDWVFIDVTGFRSLNIPSDKKLLFMHW